MNQKTGFVLKLYSVELELLNTVLSNVLQHYKKASYVRFKSVSKKLTLKKNPGGKGYAVFVKLGLKIHKLAIFFPDVKLLKPVLKLVERPKLFFETKIY